MDRMRALLFDFDGLILDTEGPDYSSWCEIYEEHGCSLPLSVWAEAIGTADHPFSPYDELEAQLRCPVNREEVRRRRRSRFRELVAAQPVLPGVEDYLRDARQLGMKVGLATSSARSWVTEHLDRLGLAPHFVSACCREDVPRTKPDPALYLRLLEQLNCRPEDAVALEDSRNGILAAKAAGVFCVAVPNPLTSSLCLDEADLRLGSLADLPLESLLGEIGRRRLR
jgi:HAD superfamily hydrolase (TIGR01509 family)